MHELLAGDAWSMAEAVRERAISARELAEVLGADDAEPAPAPEAPAVEAAPLQIENRLG